MKNKTSALILYLHRIQMNMVGKIIGASTQSVMCGIKIFYEKFESEDDLKSNIEEIEADETVSFPSKKDHIWIWKAIDHNTRKPIAWNVMIIVPKP